MMYCANSILNNPEDAEEVVHDSFLTIASHLDKLMCREPSELWYYAKLLVESKANNLNCRKNGAKSADMVLLEESL